MRRLFGRDKKKNKLFASQGDQLVQARDYNAAIVMYDAAINEAPTDVAVLISRSFAHTLLSPPRLDRALQDANAAVRHGPANWRAWSQKGDVLLKQGSLHEATEAFAEAVRLAKGEDKLAAQRSLASAEALLNQPTSTSQPPGRSRSPPALDPTAPSSATQTSEQAKESLISAQPGHGPEASSSSLSSTTPPNHEATKPPPTMERPPQPNPPAQLRTLLQQQGYQSPGTGSPLFAAKRPPAPRLPVPSVPQPTASTSAVPGQGGSGSSNTQPERPPPVERVHDTNSVWQAPVSSLPLTAEDIIDLAPEEPPRYEPAINHPDPTVRTLSQQAVETQLVQLENILKAKNKGSASIRAYTASGLIDAVQLVYVGLTQLDLTARELGTPTYPHTSFRSISVDLLSFPGNTFLNMDCESSGYYEGKLPGTVSVTGYSREYREYQLFKSPLLNLVFEGKNVLPAMTTDKIVERIRFLQRRPTTEDNLGLMDILGLSQLEALQLGWNSAAGRQRQIEFICMGLTRSVYDAPTRFIDFSKARNFSSNTLGTSTQGIGLGNFLYQVLLGAELLVRLRKEPTTSYAGLMTDNISCLLVLSTLWMKNVTIQGPLTSTVTMIPPSPKYLLIATQYQSQVEGLIRFGEALSWPYMDEARNYIEGAYRDLISGRGVQGFDIIDWLYGLILPGKRFRHRIMCCLVAASPSIRSIGPAPLWENGLVAKGKSYWSRRSVLGRVLGGLKNPKGVCGWIGPVPAPQGNITGWVRLNARRVDIPVPVSNSQSAIQSLGFGQRQANESSEALIQNLTDPDEWIQASPPERSSSDTSSVVFQSIQLTEIPSTPVSTLLDVLSLLDGKEYRASLEFKINDIVTRYTLYSNPIFIYAPPCVGTHVMHRRQVQNYLSSIIKATDLKEAYPPSDSLVIVDATGKGEEVVARAWCAERGRHAVIRRDGECCFACAAAVTVARTGLGVNVLIWSRID